MQKSVHRKIGRFISLLLTVVLVCSMIPMNAYANDETVSLFKEKLDMELNNIEEDEIKSILPSDDNLALSEVEVHAETDEKKSISSTELTDESAMPEETPLIPQEEVTETATESIAEAFASPQPETVMVVFDLDDGTQYEDLYKTRVPSGGKITHKPADPARDGYLFKGWYGYVDGNNEPVMWDFEHDTVPGNMVLLAAWEKTYLVMYDLNDGSYAQFYDVTVPLGGKVTDRPADPTREGYLFKGWYGYVDGNNEPVMWDFEHDTVPGNMVLLAAWEKTYLVMYDLNDGSYAQFYDVTVPLGGKVTDRPADPTREGYLFKGWYGYVDGNNEPVMWDFEHDTVPGNMVLLAAWEKSSNSNNNTGGNNKSENNENNSANGNSTGRNSSSESSNKNSPIVTSKAGNNSIEQKAPKFPGDSDSAVIDKQETLKDKGNAKLDNLPKTGDDITSQTLYEALILISLFMLGMCMTYIKKNT